MAKDMTKSELKAALEAANTENAELHARIDELVTANEEMHQELCAVGTSDAKPAGPQTVEVKATSCKKSPEEGGLWQTVKDCAGICSDFVVETATDAYETVKGYMPKVELHMPVVISEEMKAKVSAALDRNMSRAERKMAAYERAQAK